MQYQIRQKVGTHGPRFFTANVGRIVSIHPGGILGIHLRTVHHLVRERTNRRPTESEGGSNRKIKIAKGRTSAPNAYVLLYIFIHTSNVGDGAGTSDAAAQPRTIARTRSSDTRDIFAGE